MRRVFYCVIGCALFLWAGLESVLGGAQGQGPGPAVGDKAPEFNANTHAGELWQAEEHIGRGKYVVVYFYPAAMTGGCTKQACDYRDQAADLGGLAVEVIGISADPVNSLQLFREAHKLNFTLLSDVNGCIARQFGVPVSKGGTFKTTVGGKEVILKRPHTFARWTFILAKDGKVLHKDTAVDAAADSQKAIDFLRQMKSASKWRDSPNPGCCATAVSDPSRHLHRWPASLHVSSRLRRLFFFDAGAFSGLYWQQWSVGSDDVGRA